MLLPHTHLFSLTLDVEPLKAVQIGKMKLGRRVIVPIKGGVFEGERLQGTVEPGGHDWAFFQADGTMKIDVRLVLRTHDGELIYMEYQGRLIASSTTHRKMAAGETINRNEYSLTTVVKFETSVEKLKWLNDTVAVGSGAQSGYQPTYEVFAVGDQPVP